MIGHLRFRIIQRLLGLALGGALILAGLSDFSRFGASAGMAVMAGGEVVVMYLVCDSICPRASRHLVAGIKAATMAVFWAAAIATLWQVWHFS